MSSLAKIADYPLLFCIAIYALVALLSSPQIYVEMLVVYSEQVTIFPIIFGIALPIAGLLLHPQAPSKYMLHLLRQGGLRLLVTIASLIVGLAAFTTLKIFIPSVVPFYADPILADLDAWLHFGDPGVTLHSIMPAFLEYPLGYMYGPVWFVCWFGFIAFVALHSHKTLRQQYFWSMCLSISLLGTISAMLFSSVGPIFYHEFYGDHRYTDLLALIHQSAVGEYMLLASSYLLSNYQTDGFGMGTGISAMPSIHLAVATLNACMLTKIQRQAGMLAWCYVAIILLGSIYLGWHYAVDGYFSIGAVVLIWNIVGMITAHRNTTKSPRDCTTFAKLRTHAL